MVGKATVYGDFSCFTVLFLQPKADAPFTSDPLHERATRYDTSALHPSVRPSSVCPSRSCIVGTAEGIELVS